LQFYIVKSYIAHIYMNQLYMHMCTASRQKQRQLRDANI